MFESLLANTKCGVTFKIASYVKTTTKTTTTKLIIMLVFNGCF